MQTPNRFTLFAVAVSMLAQNNASDSPVIRVTTRMVEVNVIVRDHNGPVSDLRKEDFTVFDKGKAQKIAFFSANSSTHAPASTSAPAAAQVGSATAASPAVPLPANVFTNRPDSRAENPS